MIWNVHDFPKNPPEERQPVCPVCGAECETIVKNINGDVIGCDECLTIQDAWFYLEEIMEVTK